MGFSTRAVSIAVDENRPDDVYAALEVSGVIRSTDGGESWTDLSQPLIAPLTYCRDIIVSPDDPRVLYACLSPAARSTDGSRYRSSDLGETWQRFDHGIQAKGTMMAAAVHPRDPAKVYCIS